jgi:hypothetical protein
MPAALAPRDEARLTRALWAARAVMLWEQGAKVWAPWLLAAAALATASLWGLFETVEPQWRAGVLLAAGAGAVVFSVRGALSIRWPGRAETRARLEADSRLAHAPLTALDDARAAGDPALWELHRQAAIAAIGRARVGRPKAGLAAADPFALRYALVVAAVLALWAKGPERASHLADAFAPDARLADVSAGVSAVGRTVGGWFDPKAEAQTGRASARSD